ncbi:hypothetical protein N0V85_008465 [Neurospora sp. IMI 360204]|nr:hypothetical protein N0V85_008465 [Neurospora sp. IMI 360204]
MGYGDWTEIDIKNTSGKELSFRNCQHTNGANSTPVRVDVPDKNREISPNELNDKKIGSNGSYRFGACGRENTWSGCEGIVELWDTAANVVVAKIKYYSPHGTSYNQFSIDCPTSGWTASQTGAYLGNDQPMGNVTVTVSNH